MKKRFLVALSLLFVFSMVAVAFAYNRTNTGEQGKTVNCPMHKENASTGGEHKDSCCGMKDCCKDGKCTMGGDCCKSKDNCPMKQNAKNESTGMNMQSVTFVKSESGESCCKPGADCCKGGACCEKHKQS